MYYFDGIMLVGVESKLNLADKQVSQKIRIAWDRFFTEKMPEKILEAKRPLKTMGVYTNYDQEGNYSLIIGCPVHSLENIPDGMKGYDIPTRRYAVFSIEGQFPQAISDFWKWLWFSKSQFDFERSFTADFELYDHRFAVDKPEVDVYIAIK